MVSLALFLFFGMVCFLQAVSHDSGQFFSNCQGFVSYGFVGCREIHSDRDSFIRGQRLCKCIHFLLNCLINSINNNINNIYVFIFFNTVYVIPVYAVLFIFMIPVGYMSMFLVGVCNEGRRG